MGRKHEINIFKTNNAHISQICIITCSFRSARLAKPTFRSRYAHTPFSYRSQNRVKDRWTQSHLMQFAHDDRIFDTWGGLAASDKTTAVDN